MVLTSHTRYSTHSPRTSSPNFRSLSRLVWVNWECNASNFLDSISYTKMFLTTARLAEVLSQDLLFWDATILKPFSLSISFVSYSFRFVLFVMGATNPRCVKQWLLKHRSCPLCRSDIHKLVSPTKQQEKHRAPILRTHSSTSMFHNPFRMNSGSSTHLPAVDQSSHRPPWDSTGQDGLGAHAHSDT